MKLENKVNKILYVNYARKCGKLGTSVRLVQPWDANKSLLV